MPRVVINYDLIAAIYQGRDVSQTAKTWLDGVFRRWMINDCPSVVELLPGEYKLTERMEQMVKRGATVVRLEISPDFIEQVHHTIDFIESDQTVYPRQFALPKDIRGITVPAMFKRVEWWSRWMARSTKTTRVACVDAPGDVVVIKEWKSYTLVKLVTVNALREEGTSMGHCIGRGGYDDALREGRIEAYSIRDKENIPHVTFHLNLPERQVDQIQGLRDHAPAARYMPFILEALSIVKPSSYSQWSLDKIGYFVHEDKLWDKRLHEAAAAGDAEMVEFLLENGYEAVMNVLANNLTPMGHSLNTEAMYPFIERNASLVYSSGSSRTPDEPLNARLIKLWANNRPVFDFLSCLQPIASTIVASSGITDAIRANDITTLVRVIVGFGLETNSDSATNAIRTALHVGSDVSIKYFAENGWLNIVDDDGIKAINDIFRAKRMVKIESLVLVFDAMLDRLNSLAIMREAAQRLDADMVRLLSERYGVPTSWCKEITTQAGKTQEVHDSAIISAMDTWRSDGDFVGYLERVYPICQDFGSRSYSTALDAVNNANAAWWMAERDVPFSRARVLDIIAGDDSRVPSARIAIIKRLLTHNLKGQLRKERGSDNYVGDRLARFAITTDGRFVNYLIKNGAFDHMSKNGLGEFFKSLTVREHTPSRKQMALAYKIISSTGRSLNIRTDRHGWTLLMTFASSLFRRGKDERGLLMATELMLRLGADPNLRTWSKKEGRSDPCTTAMHQAIAYASPAMLELLIKYGGNVNALNGAGTPAFFKFLGVVFTKRKDVEQREIDEFYKKLAILRKHGMDVSLRDAEGNLAWDFIGPRMPKKGWKRDLINQFMNS